MQIHFEDLSCDDVLPEREYGPLTVADTVRWAGLQENWSQLHLTETMCVNTTACGLLSLVEPIGNHSFSAC
jgi:hypothetical protein